MQTLKTAYTATPKDTVNIFIVRLDFIFVYKYISSILIETLKHR